MTTSINPWRLLYAVSTVVAKQWTNDGMGMYSSYVCTVYDDDCWDSSTSNAHKQYPPQPPPSCSCIAPQADVSKCSKDMNCTVLRTDTKRQNIFVAGLEGRKQQKTSPRTGRSYAAKNISRAWRLTSILTSTQLCAGRILYIMNAGLKIKRPEAHELCILLCFRFCSISWNLRDTPLCVTTAK